MTTPVIISTNIMIKKKDMAQPTIINLIVFSNLYVGFGFLNYLPFLSHSLKFCAIWEFPSTER